MAAVGTKTASKPEMIEWGMEEYPSAPWKLRKFKGSTIPTADNEHLADACAIAKAGIQLQEFRQLRAMWISTVSAAA
jgi:hypothetical protein